MPKILITGNGFDLHHSLPTTYSDFINIVEFINKNEFEYNFNTIYKNAYNYKNINENFNEFEFDVSKFSQLRISAEKNLLFKFFSDEYKLDTWIDFEIKIELIINSLLDGINLMRKNLFKKNDGAQTKLGIADYKTFDNNIFIVDILAFFNIINEYPNDKGMFQVNKDFLLKRKNYITDINEEKISSQIYSQLIEFKKIFNLYLQIFVLPLLENIKNTEKYNPLFDQMDYHFTFNYTKTFEILSYNRLIRTNFLHGKCDNEDENIVFGINDVSSVHKNGKDYLKFTKYYQKLNGNTDYNFLSIINNKDKYGKFIFYFWGHSLDNSDASYINEIFDLITKSEGNIKKIFIIYHNENSRSKMILNLLKIRGREDIEMKMRMKELNFVKLNSQELNDSISIDTKEISLGNLL